MEEAKLPDLPRNGATFKQAMNESVYTADQMLAYGRECARIAVEAERERFVAMARECPDTVYRDLTIAAIRKP